jgi:hypothetical protein
LPWYIEQVSRVVLAASAVIAVAAAIAATSSDRDLELAPQPALDPHSNVTAADYVGPEVCGECHRRRFEEWSANLHRAMNRLAGEDGAVAGDFAGAELEYAGGLARFTSEGGLAMELHDPGGLVRRFRITRTIGSRYIQEYVGIEEGGDGVERRLPFGYWITEGRHGPGKTPQAARVEGRHGPGKTPQAARAEGRWFPQQYYDSWYGPEHGPGGDPAIDVYDLDPTPWASRCAWCHNTYPFELRLDRPAGNRLPIEALVSVGISCESCHFGGRAHAEGAPIRFYPTIAGAGGGRDDPAAINAICAQCHSAPSPRWPSGAAARNSREALDLAGAGCHQIKCTDCHDPHIRGPGGGAPDQRRHLEACAGCHRDLAAAHGRHRPADAGCLDCHMPRLVQGFSHAVRTHMIAAVTPALIAGADREPNACGLCHLDRSARWVLEALDEGWGARLDPRAGAPRFDVDRPLGELWLESDDPLIRVTAAEAHGRLGSRAAAPALIERLDDPIAYYRMRMVLALEGALGRRLEPGEYDPIAPPAVRAAQREALSRRF